MELWPAALTNSNYDPKHWIRSTVLLLNLDNNVWHMILRAIIYTFSRLIEPMHQLNQIT